MLMAAVNVSAAATLNVTNKTNADTVGAPTSCAVSGNTLTCTSSVFNLLPAGDETTGSEGRPAGYAWVGAQISVTGADGNKWKVDGVEYTKAEDFYFGFNKDDIVKALDNGENAIVKTLVVEWTEKTNTTTTQHKETVTLKVDIDTLTLKDEEKNSKTLWDSNDLTDYNNKHLLVTVHVGSDSGAIASKVGTDTITFRVERDSKGEVVLDEATLKAKVNSYLVEKGYALDKFLAYSASSIDPDTAFDFTTKYAKTVLTVDVGMYVKAGTTEPTPVDPQPTDPTPTDPTPVDPTPVDPTPSNPSASDPAENPDTLDNVTSVAAMGGISLAIAAAGIATLKKREN